MSMSISDLLGAYCDTLDHQRWEDWVALFAPDGRMELPGANGWATISGRDRLIRFAQRSPRGVHVSGVPTISGASGSAGPLRSVSSWLFLDLATSEQLVGYYHDEFVDTPEGLRFLVRRVEMMNGPAIQ
jgi:hypothetical protein